MAAPFGPPRVVANSDFVPSAAYSRQAAGGDFRDENVAVRQFKGPLGNLRPVVTTAEVHGNRLGESGRMLRESSELYSRAAECRACPGWVRTVLSARNGLPRRGWSSWAKHPGVSGRDGRESLFRVTRRAAPRAVARGGRLSRESAFMTNAALCLPLDSEGRNRPPTRLEIATCSHWLRETIETVAPRLVVAMGNAALRATMLMEAHSLSLKHAGAAPTAWFDRELAAVYHPGWRAERQRPWTLQEEDWRLLGQWLVETGASQRKLSP